MFLKEISKDPSLNQFLVLLFKQLKELNLLDKEVQE